MTSTSCLKIKHLSRAAYLSGTLCPSSAFHIRFHTDAAFYSYPMRSSVCNYARLCPWSSLFVFCFLKSGVLYTLQSLPAHHGQLIVLVWSTFKWTLLVSAEELTQRERTVALREALAWKKFGAIWSNLIQMLQDHLERSGKIMNKLKDQCCTNCLKDQWSPWGGFGSPREDSAGSEEPSRVVLVDLANTRHFAQAKEEGHLCCTQGTHGCFMDVSWMFHGCFMDVSWMFHGCFMDVSWMFHGCFMMLHNVSCFLGVLQVAVSKFGRSCHVLSGPEAGVRLPMTPTPARAGARFSPYEPKESQETSGDFRRLQETSGDFRRLQETSGDFRRLQETSGDFRRLQETSASFYDERKGMKRVTLNLHEFTMSYSLLSTSKLCNRTLGACRLFQLFQLFQASRTSSCLDPTQALAAPSHKWRGEVRLWVCNLSL